MKEQTISFYKPVHINILRALGQFQYLNISHLQKIGVGIKSKRRLRDRLNELLNRKRNLIGCLNLSTQNKAGNKTLLQKREYIYYLTEYGLQFLNSSLKINNTLEWKYPKGQVYFDKDYDHRCQHIDFQIDLYKWIHQTEEVTLEFFNSYFEMSKEANWKDQKRKTKIEFPNQEFFIPDGTWIMNTQKGRKLFLFELHRGKDVKRIIHQLIMHAHAIDQQIPKTKYSFDKNNRVVILFEKKQTQLAMLKRLNENPIFSMLTNFFISKNLMQEESLSPNQFYDGWLNIDGKKVKLY